MLVTMAAPTPRNGSTVASSDTGITIAADAGAAAGAAGLDGAAAGAGEATTGAGAAPFAAGAGAGAELR